MKPQELLAILKQAGKLKTNTRHCYTEADRKESVADHSWRITLMALLLKDEEEFQDVDMNKVMHMCLIHDLGESFTGDVPSFEKTSDDEESEDRQFRRWIESFPDKTRAYWKELLEELLALETREAKVYKCLDKLEAVISHNESDIGTWLPLEYDLQLTYGEDNVRFSPYFTELKRCIDQWTRDKIAGRETGREEE